MFRFFRTAYVFPYTGRFSTAPTGSNRFRERLLAILPAVFLVLCVGNATYGAEGTGPTPTPFAGSMVERFMGGDVPAPSSWAVEAGENAADPAEDSQGEKTSESEDSPEKPEPSESDVPTPSAKEPEKPEPSEPVVEKTAERKPEPRSAGDLLRDATKLLEEGKAAEALDLLSRAVEQAEKAKNGKILAAALSKTARAYRLLGDDEEAVQYLGRSIKMHLEQRNARMRSLDYMLGGEIFFDRGSFGRALKFFDESLQLLPKSEDKHRPGILEHMAQCHTRLNQYDKAVTLYRRLLSEFDRRGQSLEKATVYLKLGEIHVSRSDYPEARADFKRAAGIFNRLGKQRELGETYLRLAYLDYHRGDLKAAGAAIAKAHELMGQNGDPTLEALPLFVSAIEARNAGDVVRAVKRLNQAYHHYHRIGDRAMAARVKLELAVAEFSRARMKAALELSGQALNEFRALSDLGGESTALRLIAEIYLNQGFMQKALEYAQESLAVARRIKDTTRECEARVILATLHTRLGDTDFAAKLLKEAVRDSAPPVPAGTRARVFLALARFRLDRDAAKNALNIVNDARKLFASIDDARGIADCDNLAGEAYERIGRSKDALTHLKSALEGHRRMWDRLGVGRDLTALGVYYKNRADFDKALNYLQEALDLRRGLGDQGGAAANLANIGIVYKHKNKFAEAVEHLKQSLEIYRRLADKTGEADVCANLGNVLAAQGTHSEAQAKLETALAIHREIQDARGTSVDLTGLGRLHLLKGNTEKASEYLREALEISERINYPRGRATILAELAMVEQVGKQPARALDLLKQALRTARDIGDKRMEASVLLKTASVFRDAGETDKALKLLENTLEMMERNNDRKGRLWALGELGILRTRAEDFESALKHLHEAVKLRTELGLPASVARDLDFHLGEIYLGFKEYESALEHYRKALAVAQISGSESILGKIHDRIGNTYYQIEEYEKAKEFFEDALRLHTESRNAAMQMSELIKLGDILSKLSDSEGALKYQLRALSLTRELGDPRSEARVLTRIGTLQQMLGRPRTAIEYYEQARDKRTMLGDHRGVNENLLQIALVRSILGKFESAVSELKRAFHLAQCSDDKGMLWKAYFVMGRALQGKRRWGEALEAYRKAITILEAMEADIMEESEEDDFIFGGKKALFETTLTVLMRLARKDPEGAYDHQALRIVEKLKAAEFESVLSRINVERFADLPQDLLIKEKSLKLGLRKLDARLARLSSSGTADRGKTEKLLEERRAREKAFKELKARIIRDYPAYAGFRYPPAVSVHRLQKDILDPHEAVLEYMVTRSRTYLFAIDKKRFHTYSLDYSLDELAADVQTLLRPLYRAESQASWDPSVAYRIYERIIQPVEYFLAGKKTVVIVPHGPLAALPFEALVTSESHAEKRFWSSSDPPAYLVNKYAMCYAPSAAALSFIRSRKREKTAKWNLAAFGDVVYNDPDGTKELNPGAGSRLPVFSRAGIGTRGDVLAQLPGTRREVTEIAKILGEPAQVYLGGEATETLFKKADLERYNYIHLATHGVLLSTAGKLLHQPAIVFSLYGDRENDGFLQMGEIFSLKLNAELVTLSSCLVPPDRPAASDPGLQSLANAFLYSGSDSVILSMWQVNDNATARLFIDMYKRLEDSSKAEALRRAKLTLIDTPGTGHPYYWAPFILVGNWNVVNRPGFNRMDPGRMRFKGLSTWRRFFSL